MHRLIIIVFLILSLKSQCQITISNIIFYEVGDTIFQNIDNNPAHSKITPASANKQYWNFSQLKADRLKRDTIHGIKPGDTIKKYFPTAILTQPFQNFGTEYIDITSTEVRGLGLDASFLGIRFIQPYIGKRIIQFAPISLNTAKSSNSSATFAINLAAIPFLSQLIQNLIPIPGATIDSIRLNLNTKSDFIADAYGELITPFDTIEVLRVRQENKTSTKIEGKVKILIFSTWQDVSTFLPIPLPKDTTIIYHFYNNKIKDPIVSINADKNNQITSTNFKFYPKKSLDTTKIDTTSDIFIIADNTQKIKIIKLNGTHQLSIPAVWQNSVLEIYSFNGKRLFSTLLDNSMNSNLELPLHQIIFITVTKNGKSYSEKIILEE